MSRHVWGSCSWCVVNKNSNKFKYQGQSCFDVQLSWLFSKKDEKDTKQKVAEKLLSIHLALAIQISFTVNCLFAFGEASWVVWYPETILSDKTIL